MSEAYRIAEEAAMEIRWKVHALREQRRIQADEARGLDAHLVALEEALDELGKEPDCETCKPVPPEVREPSGDDRDYYWSRPDTPEPQPGRAGFNPAELRAWVPGPAESIIDESEITWPSEEEKARKPRAGWGNR